MVEPKDGIEGGIRDVAHVSTVSDQTMDGIVHVLQAVIQSTPAVRVAGIGERSIIGLLRDELISLGTKPVSS